MSAVLVLAPENATDPVLVRARWVAGANERRLVAEGHDVRVERSFRGTPEVPDQVDGVAFFGHGTEDGLSDGDGRPVFGGAAVATLSGRWVHAFACDAAERFGPRAVGAGAHTFAGYARRLSPSWDEANLSETARALGERVVSTVSAGLAGGAGERALREELYRAVDALFLELDRQPAADFGDFLVFCQSQIEGLVVLGAGAGR